MPYFSDTLKELKTKNLLRELRSIESAQNSVIVFQNAEYINFSSNNYLGLATHPQMMNASIEATLKYGCGSGASRLVTGSMSLHKELETQMAAFKKSPACLVFNSGYQANTSIIPALTKSEDVIFSDSLNHASLIDGCRLSAAKKIIYPHNDTAALAQELKKEQLTRKKDSAFWIVTDGVFSMDGDLCDLPALKKLADEYDAKIYIDDAHGTGVFGKNGTGIVEYFNLCSDERILQMGTFSKALGSFGAYLCGSKEIIDFLINKARGFIYSTALPPGVIAANLQAIKIIKEQPELRTQLWDNIHLLQKVAPSLSPILPLIVGDEKRTLQFSEKLFEQGIWAQAIRPPTVPQGTSRIRLTVSANHTSSQIQKLLAYVENLELQIQS